MGIKKIMTYGRYVLMITLVIYLILVWMYFKDNPLQLTSSSLLLWFVIIPLALFGAIWLIRWRQKKSEDKAVVPANIKNQEDKPKQPDCYSLFMYSSLCLPEGEHWSDIVDNDDDLTTLSTDLSDFDGLPVLIKPIARVITEPAQLYAAANNVDDADFNDQFNDESDGGFKNSNFDTESNVDRADDTDNDIKNIDGLTLRLAALIQHQLSLSNEALSVLAQHFDERQQYHAYEPNSAIHIHPEWQQHYIASATEDNSKTVPASTPIDTLTQLSVYVCVPALADPALLINVIKQQLATYGISEQLLTITTVVTDNTDSVNTTATADKAATGNTESEQFINEHLMVLSKQSIPEVCLLIAADSQINEEWLESHMYAGTAPNIVPTEASTLLLFCNKAAQDILAIDATVKFLLTEISEIASKEAANSNNLTSDNIHSTPINKRHHYSNNLHKIKYLLLDNSFHLSPLDNKPSSAQYPSIPAKKQRPETTAKQTNIAASLAEESITILSDINLATQPYDITAFMAFIDSFVEKGVLVNEHHLGHYMPLNSWLKPFVSLALLVDMASNNQQQSDYVFLVTQHQKCCMLWLADCSPAS